MDSIWVFFRRRSSRVDLYGEVGGWVGGWVGWVGRGGKGGLIEVLEYVCGWLGRWVGGWVGGVAYLYASSTNFLASSSMAWAVFSL